jgi:hypothetical protein
MRGNGGRRRNSTKWWGRAPQRSQSEMIRKIKRQISTRKFDQMVVGARAESGANRKPFCARHAQPFLSSAPLERNVPCHARAWMWCHPAHTKSTQSTKDCDTVKRFSDKSHQGDVPGRVGRIDERPEAAREGWVAARRHADDCRRSDHSGKCCSEGFGFRVLAQMIVAEATTAANAAARVWDSDF